MTQRQAPPTRRSTSQTTRFQPGGPPAQRLRSSGLVEASKTSRRGASKTRVMAISRSDGILTCSVPVSVIGGLLGGLAPGEAPVRAPSLAGVRPLQRGDVDLLHLKHRLHDPLRLG